MNALMTVKAASERTARLLVVDDDDRLRRLLVTTLTRRGFWVDAAASSSAADDLRQQHHYDLMVVDVMMPGESGTHWTQRLRAGGDNIAVLLLTALGDSSERIDGLKAGADDYLAKPFEPEELVLRIQAILRRQLPLPEVPASVRFGAYCFNAQTRLLTRGEEAISLTGAEADLLALLASRPGRAVSRFELSQLVGGDTDSRAVDVTVNRLRRKLDDTSRSPLHLQTVRGEGYALMTDEPV